MGSNIVAITAANSAVGQAILGLRDPGPVRLQAGVRSERAARQLPPIPEGKGSVVRISYQSQRNLQRAFREAAAVIHLAGILVERPSSSYREAHVETTSAVLQAAGRCGVRKIVLVSAVGADPTSRNGYFRSKGEAEELVRNSSLPYTIIRVPLLLGRATEGAAALRRNLRGRLVWLIGGGRHLQQPLDVTDVAKGCLAATTHRVARGTTLTLVGPECLAERELLMRAARLQNRRLRILGIPKTLVSLALRLKRGGSGFSRDALEVITGHQWQDPVGGATSLGIPLTGLDEMIRHSLGENAA